MTNRDYKQFAPGAIVHAYNRGNNKEKIFFEEQDYKSFLFRLGLVLGFTNEELNGTESISLPHSRIRITKAVRDDFILHAFCLMPNHFHLIIEQKNESSTSKLILKLCTSYAKYLNKKYERIGHVFQDQFKSVIIESNEQLMWLSAYVHMNPVNSGLVKAPYEHEWSSYKDYIEKRNLPFLNTDFIKSIFGPNFEKETLAAVSKVPFDIL